MAFEFESRFHARVRKIEWKTVRVKGCSSPVEAPSTWSETAVEIAATKYFRRGETSVKQLVARVTSAIRHAAEWQGYLDSKNAQVFEEEMRAILLLQIASFNSPVYFNVGMFPTHGVTGAAENYYFDPQIGRAAATASAFVRPQASACFIQDVQDNLIGIFDLLKNEAKLFKYGSGTGTNFSRLRAKGERLQDGGASTGLISYLDIFDKAAHAIKSGGTNRCAAKMVVLDADHPEIFEFVRWKMLEERKARVLLANGYSGGMDGEAFSTVSGQNSNNSVRVSAEFMRSVEQDGPWLLKGRKDQSVSREVRGIELWREISRAAWECADPGLHYQEHIARAHICPKSGEIRASNPCSEFMFLDDTACNLASLNLAAFMNDASDGIDWADFKQCVRVMLFAQDALIDYASYPTAAVAENSHHFRPLGLGYANLGGMLMRMAIPYDSDPGRRWTARITATLQALALETSAEMAEHLGPFSSWKINREAPLEVLNRQREAAMTVDPRLFDRALKLIEKHGLRNAQVTLIAPTGTIGLLMDCDTLGIEPDFALSKLKQLSGGGELKLLNRSVPRALGKLGYTDGAREEIIRHIAANGTAAGARVLKPEHLPIFDTAVPPPGFPERRISVAGHLGAMASAQPFLSGAISKTVNLPASASVEDVQKIYLEGYRLGLKSLAVYRDGSKALQPLCAEC